MCPMRKRHSPSQCSDTNLSLMWVKNERHQCNRNSFRLCIHANYSYGVFLDLSSLVARWLRADTRSRQPTDPLCLKRGGEKLNPKQSHVAAIVLDKLVRFYCLPLLVRDAVLAEAKAKANHIPFSLLQRESSQRRQQHTLWLRWLRGRKAQLKQRHDSLPPSIPTWDRPPHRPLVEVAGGYQGMERRVLIELRTCYTGFLRAQKQAKLEFLENRNTHESAKPTSLAPTKWSQFFTMGQINKVRI